MSLRPFAPITFHQGSAYLHVVLVCACIECIHDQLDGIIDIRLLVVGERMSQSFKTEAAVLLEMALRPHDDNPYLDPKGRLTLESRFANLAPDGANVVLTDDVRGRRVGALRARVETWACLALRSTRYPKLNPPISSHDHTAIFTRRWVKAEVKATAARVITISARMAANVPGESLRLFLAAPPSSRTSIP